MPATVSGAKAEKKMDDVGDNGNLEIEFNCGMVNQKEIQDHDHKRSQLCHSSHDFTI